MSKLLNGQMFARRRLQLSARGDAFIPQIMTRRKQEQARIFKPLSGEDAQKCQAASVVVAGDKRIARGGESALLNIVTIVFQFDV